MPRTEHPLEIAMKTNELYNRRQLTLFPPVVLENLGSSASIDIVTGLLDKEASVARNSETLSSESHQLIRNTITKVNKERGGDWTSRLQATLFQAVLDDIDGGSDVIEMDLDIIEAALRLLIDECHKGTLKISDKIKDKEVSRLEKHALNLRKELVARRSMKSQIAGEVVDKIIRDSDADKYPIMLNGKSYIDILALQYRQETSTKVDLFRPKDYDRLDKFRKTVWNQTGLPNQARGRCCITGNIGEIREDIIAVPIIPFNIGEHNAKYLFGDDPTQSKTGHLLSVGNALPMKRRLMGAFEEGKFSIVPATCHEHHPSQWKVLILDDEWHKDYEKQCGSIRDKVLKFKRDFQPDKRYLYFVHLVKVFKRFRHRPSEWWKTIHLSLSESLKLESWGIPWGKSLRLSAIMVLGRRAAHLKAHEAASLMCVNHKGQEGYDLEDGLRKDPSEKARLFSDFVCLSMITIEPTKTSDKDLYIGYCSELPVENIDDRTIRIYHQYYYRKW